MVINRQGRRLVCRSAVFRVGDASSASIPLAIHDAVRDGIITKPTRVFAPGFGAGVLRATRSGLDPAVIAPDNSRHSPSGIDCRDGTDDDSGLAQRYQLQAVPP
jgi:3-oxoacyl-[acyl-carrier-protein] synthase III